MNRSRSKDLSVEGQSRNVDRKRKMTRPRFLGLGREMYLVGDGGPLDMILSGSGNLVHGPLDGRCKAKNWNTLILLVPVLRFRACPSVCALKTVREGFPSHSSPTWSSTGTVYPNRLGKKGGCLVRALGKGVTALVGRAGLLDRKDPTPGPGSKR
ncbi:hypothetical protein ACH5RR_039306 [Cinchona calisaya]|uniref:Uncharacterized protein n=1 Tax=Cinchona calisaya TaxID=153742 RepID=A0ABD2XZ93_9GENT